MFAGRHGWTSLLFVGGNGQHSAKGWTEIERQIPWVLVNMALQEATFLHRCLKIGCRATLASVL
jgi:hypothetical protein